MFDISLHCSHQKVFITAIPHLHFQIKMIIKPRFPLEAKVIPRNKRNVEVRTNHMDFYHEVIVINANALAPYFQLPLKLATNGLGICSTVLKRLSETSNLKISSPKSEKICRACRHIGIKKWAYRKDLYPEMIMVSTLLTIFCCEDKDSKQAYCNCSSSTAARDCI